jgi:LAGLIDADG endonuclease
MVLKTNNVLFENLYKLPSETTREDISSSQRWAIGLIEGDGHIGLEWTNASKNKWVPILKVTLKAYNARAIYKLKQCLGVGKISRSGNKISLRVRSRQLWLSHLIPLFQKFPFRTSKYYDFAIVKKALSIDNFYNDCLISKSACIHNTKQKQISILNTYGTDSCDCKTHYKQQIENLKQQLNPKAKLHRNQLSPIWNNVLGLCSAISPPFKVNEINFKLINMFNGVCKTRLATLLDNNWLAGFVEAEGSFYILSNGQHGFALGQTYDIYVIAAIHYLFNIKAQLKVRHNYVMLDTKNTCSLFLISNAMDKKLLGLKSFIFSLWLRTLRKKSKAKSLKAKQIINALRSRVC